MINIKKWFNLSGYISDLDRFLIAFDQAQHKLSLAQQKEHDKYARIYQLRDRSKG